jgi:hypothetical protein
LVCWFNITLHEEVEQTIMEDIRLSFEDPRYKTLHIDDESVYLIVIKNKGYVVEEDGTLERICICAARSSSECVCGGWNSGDDYDDDLTWE